MKKIVASTILSVCCIPVFAEPVDVTMNVVTHYYEVLSMGSVNTYSENYVTIANNTDLDQAVTLDFNYCVSGGGCDHDLSVVTVAAHKNYGATYQLKRWCKYGVGYYPNWAFATATVNSTGRKFKSNYSQNGTRSL